MHQLLAKIGTRVDLFFVLLFGLFALVQKCLDRLFIVLDLGCELLFDLGLDCV